MEKKKRGEEKRKIVKMMSYFVSLFSLFRFILFFFIVLIKETMKRRHREEDRIKNKLKKN